MSKPKAKPTTGLSAGTFSPPRRSGEAGATPAVTSNKLPSKPPQRTAEVTDEDIRVRAYQLWEQAGRPHGQDDQLWLQAEQELRKAAADGSPS